jgi:hypothetical protein
LDESKTNAALGQFGSPTSPNNFYFGQVLRKFSSWLWKITAFISWADVGKSEDIESKEYVTSKIKIELRMKQKTIWMSFTPRKLVKTFYFSKKL